MRLLLLAACLFTCGCHGPLTKPMVDRLEEHQQATVDAAWTNMFTPVDHLDRTLLIDAVLAGQLHQYGVDSLHLVSEKYVGDDLVVMEIHYDRAEPQSDEFTLTYLDSDGRELRRETYARQDIEGRIQFLFETIIVTEDMAPEEREEAEVRAAEQKARWEEIKLAIEPLEPVVWMSPVVTIGTPLATDGSAEGGEESLENQGE